MVTRAPEGAVPREILWADVLEFLERPTATLRAMARTEADAGQAEDIVENSMLAIAEEIRELDAKEERLVELTLKKLITPSVLHKKANALRAERGRAEQRLAQARNARALALRAGTESASVRRMLASLRQRAEAIGADDASRALIVRTVTKQIVAHRMSGRSRLEVTYAFAASPASDRSASADRAVSSASLAIETPVASSSSGYRREISRSHAVVSSR